MSWRARGWVVLAALGFERISVAAPDCTACACGTCVLSPRGNLLEERKYRINASEWTQFANQNGLSQTEIERAVILAADSLNQQLNGRYFTYAGTTDLTSEDFDTAAKCASHDFSLVWFRAGCVDVWNGTLYALNSELACDDKFAMTVFDEVGSSNSAFPPRCTPGPPINTWSWGNELAPSGAEDLVGVLTHELGHAAGLGHPNCGEEANMQYTPSPWRIRWLYEFDHVCARQLSGGSRDTSGYYRVQQTDGTFGGATKFTGNDAAAKARVGRSQDASLAWHWDALWYTAEPFVKFDRDINGSPATPSLSENNGTFGVGFWPETPGTDRLFWTQFTDTPVKYDFDSVHTVGQLRSTDGFQTPAWGDLKHCTAMSGPMACTATADVHSADPLAVAWLDSTKRSVVAWTNLSRSLSTTPKPQEIGIAVGHVNNFTLAEPTWTGVQSAVGPGVACKESFSGYWDCILVYVPADDLTLPIRVRRMNVLLYDYSYVVGLEEPVTMNFELQTASAPAVWYYDGYFYLAYRKVWANQKLIVRRTSATGDLAAWLIVQDNLDNTVLGPSVTASYIGASQRLVYVK